jgi:hypothetical protein
MSLESSFLESSLQLAAQVASENLQQQRPRSAFFPPRHRSQLPSTPSKGEGSAAGAHIGACSSTQSKRLHL